MFFGRLTTQYIWEPPGIYLGDQVISVAGNALGGMSLLFSKWRLIGVLGEKEAIANRARLTLPNRGYCRLIATSSIGGAADIESSHPAPTQLQATE